MSFYKKKTRYKYSKLSIIHIMINLTPYHYIVTGICKYLKVVI